MPSSFILGLIGVTVISYLLQSTADSAVVAMFALWPGGGDWLASIPWSAPWQLFTYSLLHGDLMHLVFNMFGVWMFGSQVERVWGAPRTALTWLLSVFTAAVTHLLVGGLLNMPPAPMVGASGGVFGILLAYAMLFPHARVMLLLPPIPLPARVFVAIYAAFELYSGVTGSSDGVAHFAHLGGLIGGWIGYRHGHRWTRLGR